MKSQSSTQPERTSNPRPRILSGVTAVVIAASLLAAAPVSAITTTSVTPGTAVASASVLRPADVGLMPAAAYSSSPFVSSPANKTWYRIPAIIQDAQGHLLAFAERRDSDNSDMGNFDVVMRQSTDGGRTWGVLKTIANDGANRVSNPVPLLTQNGEVLLLTSVRNANDEYQGVFLQRSTDGGETFTSHAGAQIARPLGHWNGGLTGPGHGIVLTKGIHAGRIVVAMGYKTSTLYGAYCIFSDDNGRTWRTGYDEDDVSGKRAYIEGTIAELPNGDLYIDYRDKNSTTPGETRLCAISSDGGATLSQGFRRQSALKLHSVEGSVLSLTGTHSGELLFSSPTYTSAKDRSLRRDMGIFTSTTSGVSWSTPYQVDLESRPAAYSDLVQIDDSTVGILYETGTSKWRERITFRAIQMSELTNPTKVASSVKAALGRKTVSTSGKTSVKVAVAVKGVVSPSGKVLVRLSSKNKRTRTLTVKLTYSNKGRRYVTLPRLKTGKYKVSVIYKGTARIHGKTVQAGTLGVKKR